MVQAGKGCTGHTLGLMLRLTSCKQTGETDLLNCNFVDIATRKWR